MDALVSARLSLRRDPPSHHAPMCRADRRLRTRAAGDPLGVRRADRARGRSGFRDLHERQRRRPGPRSWSSALPGMPCGPLCGRCHAAARRRCGTVAGACDSVATGPHGGREAARRPAPSIARSPRSAARLTFVSRSSRRRSHAAMPHGAIT